MKRDLVAKLQDDFIVAQLAIIAEIRVSDEMKTAINAKITANQNAQTAQNLVKQKEAEANQKVEIARGDSAQTMISSTAQAQATRLTADAESYANEKVSRSITTTLIEWRKANAWDGKLPQVTGSGGQIIDLRK